MECEWLAMLQFTIRCCLSHGKILQQSTDRGSPQSFLLTKDEAVEGLNQLIVKRSILYRTRKAIADWDIIQKLL